MATALDMEASMEELMLRSVGNMVIGQQWVSVADENQNCRRCGDTALILDGGGEVILDVSEGLRKSPDH